MSWRGLYAGAADWGGKDPAKCNRGLYRLATDTGTWTTLERGLPDAVEVRCVTLHPTQPGVVFAGTQAGPYRSTDAGDTWERMHFPGDEPVVWSFEIHPADARVMYVGTQDMAVYRSEDGGGHWRRLTVPTNPDGLCVMGFPTRMIRLAIDLDQSRRTLRWRRSGWPGAQSGRRCHLDGLPCAVARPCHPGALHTAARPPPGQ